MLTSKGQNFEIRMKMPYRTAGESCGAAAECSQHSSAWFAFSAGPMTTRNAFRTHVRKGGEAMASGTVKRLVRERGFGFIQGSNGVELFFHRSTLQGEAFDSLVEGQAVEFDVEQGDKGPRAANVKVRPPSA